MYSASLILSRLFLIASLALPAFAFWMGAFRCPTQMGPPCHHSAPLEVERARFGVDHWQAGEGYVFTETDHIHLVPGTSFGWQLQLQGPVDNVTLREEFVLPAAPSYWGLGPDTRLSADRRTAVTERVVTPEDGFLSSQWTITPGDPAGLYEMRVFLDGELVRSFEFEVHEAH